MNSHEDERPTRQRLDGSALDYVAGGALDERAVELARGAGVL